MHDLLHPCQLVVEISCRMHARGSELDVIEHRNIRALPRTSEHTPKLHPNEAAKHSI